MQAEAHSNLGMARSVLVFKRAGFFVSFSAALNCSSYGMLVFCSSEIAVTVLYRASAVYVRVHNLVCSGQRLISHKWYILWVGYAKETLSVCYCVVGAKFLISFSGLCYRVLDHWQCAPMTVIATCEYFLNS